MKKKRIVISDDDESVRTVCAVNLCDDSDSDSDGYTRKLAYPKRSVFGTDRSDNSKIIPAPSARPRSSLVVHSELSDSDTDDDSDSDDELISSADDLIERSETTGDEALAGPRVKSRGWCFTVNNYSDSDIHRFRDFHAETDGCKYLIIGKEVGEQGTPHLQGYIYVQNPRYGNVLRAACGGIGHWSAAKGTAAQNQTYCSKEGDFMEYGELPKQGKRNDLATLVQRVCTEGATMQSLIDGGEHDVLATYLRNEKSVTKLVSMVQGKRDSSVTPTVHWIWGQTGTGKSRWAYENFPDAYRVSTDGNGWWCGYADGYAGEKVVVMDDYRANAFSYSMLLKILDRYPLKVKMKGSMAELLATHFIITSNQKPEDVYNKGTEAINQLKRRITKVELMGPEPLAPIFITPDGVRHQSAWFNQDRDSALVQTRCGIQGRKR